MDRAGDSFRRQTVVAAGFSYGDPAPVAMRARDDRIATEYERQVLHADAGELSRSHDVPLGSAAPGSRLQAPARASTQHTPR